PETATPENTATLRGRLDVISQEHKEIDKAREKRGLSKLYSPEKLTNEAAWEAALTEIDANPLAGKTLVDRLIANPSSTTPVENGILLHEYAAREIDF